MLKIKNRLIKNVPPGLLLISIYPILSLAASNIHEIKIDSITLPLLFVGLNTIGYYLWFRGVFNSHKRSVVFVSFFLIMFFSYGYVKSLFYPRYTELELLFIRELTFFSFWLVFTTYLLIFVTRTKRLDSLYRFINIFALVIIVFPAVSIARFYLETDYKFVSAERSYSNMSAESNSPDIIYVILDRYAGEKTLLNEYNFDNTEFLNELEDRGFFVDHSGYSNYLKTGHYLASTLNMTYLDNLTSRYGPDSKDWRPLIDMVHYDKVTGFLQERGYNVVFFGNFWHVTSKKPNADININLFRRSEFENELFLTTPLSFLSNSAIAFEVISKPSMQHERTIYQLDILENIEQFQSPKFIIAHLLITHPPYVFNEDGSKLSPEDLNKLSNKQKYIMQVKFTNHMILNMLDKWKSGMNDPVILIQADEGPFPVEYHKNNYAYDWTKQEDKVIDQKLEILSAFYLPGGKVEVVPYEGISPVNNFRLIFNKYFDQAYELLPDRHFIFSTDRTPYDLHDVTSILDK